jgi:hypothetical protein
MSREIRRLKQLVSELYGLEQVLLALSSGNISRASQMAGRYQADFYKLLKKYGLHPSEGKTKALAFMAGPLCQPRVVDGDGTSA